MEELYKQLAALARQHGARRLVLFGSRARGDNRYNSDVDLAVYGMPEGNRANFWMDCESRLSRPVLHRPGSPAHGAVEDPAATSLPADNGR